MIEASVLRQKALAFSVHISLSLLIFISFYLVAAYLWYPDFYYSANNVWRPIATIAFVDVGLGPILTFVLYKRGKPGLTFDLSMIATFQILALLWGVWMLNSQRPVLNVYHDGLFFCLNAAQAEAAGADLSRFAGQSGPVPMAYLPLPASAEEQKQRAEKLNALPPGTLGVPAYVFGDHFVPFGQPGQMAQMLRAELDLTQVIALSPQYQQRWDRFLAKHPAAADYAYFGLVCSSEEHVLALDRNSGAPVDAVALSLLQAKRKH